MKKLTNTLNQLLRNEVILSNNEGTFSLGIKSTLDRKTYDELNDCLKRIGGIWNRSKKVHTFKYDPSPLIQRILSKEELPELNPTAFFPTPKAGLDAMWDLCDHGFFEYKAEQKSGVRVLEPSAGIGAVADFIKTKGENVFVDTVEFLEENQEILKGKGYSPYCGSFLDYDSSMTMFPDDEDNLYDLIIMNPPFSVKGDSKAYMTHIYHALTLMKSGGELIAIIPNGWIRNTTKKDSDFRDLLAEKGDGFMITLEQGTFKESGTNVETRVIRLTNSHWKAEPHKGFASFHEWAFSFYGIHQHSVWSERLLTFGKDLSEGKCIEEKLKDFANTVISAYAEGALLDSMQDRVDEGTFFPKKHFGSYLNILRKHCEEVASELGYKKPKTTPSISIKKQLEIVGKGGGLLDLMVAS